MFPGILPGVQLINYLAPKWGLKNKFAPAKTVGANTLRVSIPGRTGNCCETILPIRASSLSDLVNEETIAIMAVFSNIIQIGCHWPGDCVQIFLKPVPLKYMAFFGITTSDTKKQKHFQLSKKEYTQQILQRAYRKENLSWHASFGR